MPVTLKDDDRSTGIVPVRIGVTAIVAVVLCESEPETPVTVTVAVAGAVVLVVVSVSVLAPVVLAGLNVAVTPAGSPAAESSTRPSKLPRGITITLVFPVFPRGMEMLLDAVDSVKSFVPAFVDGS